jgi:hypothetical protein
LRLPAWLLRIDALVDAGARNDPMNKRKIILLSFAVLFVGWFGFSQSPGLTEEVQTISVRELNEVLGSDGLRIIDVRRADHYLVSKTRIRGAERRDPATVSRWIDVYSPSDRIVLYCA